MIVKWVFPECIPLYKGHFPFPISVVKQVAKVCVNKLSTACDQPQSDLEEDNFGEFLQLICFFVQCQEFNVYLVFRLYKYLKVAFLF